MAIAPVTAFDAFTRTTTAGLGVSDSGHIWKNAGGTDSNRTELAVNSTNGFATLTFAAGSTYSGVSQYLATTSTSTYGTALMRVKFNAEGYSQYVGLCLRNGGGRYVGVRLICQPNGYTRITSVAITSNNFMQQINEATERSDLPKAAWLWMKLTLSSDGNLVFKAWKDGTAEPSDANADLDFIRDLSLTVPDLGYAKTDPGYPGFFYGIDGPTSIQTIDIESLYYTASPAPSTAGLPVTDGFIRNVKPGLGLSTSGHLWTGSFADDYEVYAASKLGSLSADSAVQAVLPITASGTTGTELTRWGFIGPTRTATKANSSYTNEYDATMTVKFTAATGYAVGEFGFGLLGGYTIAAGGITGKQGYALNLTPETASATAKASIVEVTSTGAFTTLATMNLGYSITNAKVNCRLMMIGSAIKVKVWLASALEPAGWMLEATDTTYTSGVPFIYTRNSTKTAGSITLSSLNVRTLLLTAATISPTTNMTANLTLTLAPRVYVAASLSGQTTVTAPPTFLLKGEINATGTLAGKAVGTVSLAATLSNVPAALTVNKLTYLLKLQNGMLYANGGIGQFIRFTRSGVTTFEYLGRQDYVVAATIPATTSISAYVSRLIPLDTTQLAPTDAVSTADSPVMIVKGSASAVWSASGTLRAEPLQAITEDNIRMIEFVPNQIIRAEQFNRNFDKFVWALGGRSSQAEFVVPKFLRLGATANVALSAVTDRVGSPVTAPYFQLGYNVIERDDGTVQQTRKVTRDAAAIRLSRGGLAYLWGDGDDDDRLFDRFGTYWKISTGGFVYINPALNVIQGTWDGDDPSSPPSTAPGQFPVGSYVKTTDGGVRLRAGAGTNYSILLEMPIGTKLKITGAPVPNGGWTWYPVMYTDSTRFIAGWSAGEYLALVPGTTASATTTPAPTGGSQLPARRLMYTPLSTPVVLFGPKTQFVSTRGEALTVPTTYKQAKGLELLISCDAKNTTDAKIVVRDTGLSDYSGIVQRVRKNTVEYLRGTVPFGVNGKPLLFASNTVDSITVELIGVWY